MAHEHHHEHGCSHEHRHEHESEHELGHGCCEHCCHEHGGEEEDRRGRIIKLAVSAVLFVAALLCEHVFRLNGIICLVIYIAAFCVVGYEVVIEAFKGLFHGEPLDECFLMTVASVGAFFTGSYGEAAAVMILYSLGEFLQDLAVDKSRDSISELIDIVPKTATVIRSGEYIEIDADDVEIGDTVAVKPGENVPVDGVVISGRSSVNMSALTGESLPADVCECDSVLGGYLNLTGEIRIRAEKEFDDSAASRIKGSVTGLSTGFTDLDNRTAGLQPADFILIAARPSMGKTALVLNIAEHASLRENRCIGIFSLEMSKEQLVNRIIAMQSHVDAQKIRTGDLTETEWAEIIESAERIGESRLIIDDTPAISVPELRSKCRKYKLEFGLEMVIIDYLQLMSGSGRSGDSRQQEISDISRSLKALARELNVPVVALSQLSRAVESRPNHRPMLSDLRESGAIEQDADLVMFIYRDDYYNEDSEKKGIAEIIIAKQRNGPIGTVELSWQPQLTKFANLAR